MKKNKKNIIVTGIVLLALMFVGYSFLKGEDAVLMEAKTIVAKKGNVTTMVTATGTIEPITQVEIGTQVSGVVKKVYVDFNSVVKQGQLIAELDKTNLSAAKTQVQAVYDNAINERNYMKIIFDRQKALYENQVISKADYEASYYNYQAAKGIVAQRYSDLQQAKTNLGYANIYSPINGVVLSRAIDEGQTVAASLSTPTLFTIAQDLKEMQVEADVDEADIGQVKVGQRVSFTVDAYQGEVFEGMVTQVRLAPTVTSNVVTYTVVIKAENPDLKLKPGLTATIAVYTLELKDVLTLEAKAINFKPSEALLRAYNVQHGFANSSNSELAAAETLWVLNNQGAIVPIKVVLGASDGVSVQIVSGLKEGEKLVYSLKSTKVSETKNKGANESPFMPQRPGGKKKN